MASSASCPAVMSRTDAIDADDLPAGVAMRSVRVQGPAASTGLGDHVFELARLWLARPMTLRRSSPMPAAMTSGKMSRRPSAENAVRGQARQLLHRGVPDDVTEVEVEDDQPFAGAGDDRLDEGVPLAHGGLGAAAIRHVLDHRHHPGRPDA